VDLFGGSTKQYQKVLEVAMEELNLLQQLHYALLLINS